MNEYIQCYSIQLWYNMYHYRGFKAIIISWHLLLWCTWAKGSDTCNLFLSTHSIWMMNMTQICYVRHRNNDVILPSYENILCFRYLGEKKEVHVCDCLWSRHTTNSWRIWLFLLNLPFMRSLHMDTCRLGLDTGFSECYCGERWEMRSEVRGTYGELCGWLRLDNRCKHLLPQHTRLCQAGVGTITHWSG